MQQKENSHARFMVHGYIASLSPMKSNAAGTTKYFHGELTDGKSNKRVVGFDAKIHQRFNSFRERNEPVAVSNCEVKQSNYTSDLEIVVRKSSDLEKSPTKYEDVDVTKFKSDAENDIIVALNELPCLANFQKVTVKIKVIDVSDAVKIKDLLKQEYMITDSIGTSKIIAWESNVGVLQQGMSYKLSGMNVRTYNNKKYLSIARDGFTISEIDDIGEVERVYETECKITQAVVVGIKYFDVYIACYACNSKVIATSDVLGDCTRCATTPRIDKCKEQHSAKLDLESKG